MRGVPGTAPSEAAARLHRALSSPILAAIPLPSVERSRAACRPPKPSPSEGTSMSPDFIYTMKDLRKVVPPKREILKGIWLSFYHGAKIGVLGVNGAGKSSLLKIMGGVVPDF